MKATELLQKQHRDIEALLERLHTAGQGEENRIRQELASHLVAHTVIEEEIFYPVVREIMPDEALEALEEHALADVALARLLAAKDDRERADAKRAVLSEVVLRHIRREESEILKAADRELGDEHLDELGNHMALRFKQVIDTGYQKPLQRALAAVVPGTTARPALAKKAARRGAAKKAAKGRRAATAKRAPARRAAEQRAGAKRATAQRAGTKRGTAQRAGTRKAAQKPASRARRSAAGAARRRA